MKSRLCNQKQFKISVICDYGANKCMFSCHQDKDEMKDDLNNILNGKETKFCNDVFKIPSSYMSNRTADLEHLKSESSSEILLNAALFLAVDITLSLSILFAVLSAVSSLLNVWCSSPYGMLNVPGLFYINGIVIGLIGFTIVLYGSLYGSYIQKNIAIADTLSKFANYSSEGLADLGYSYWILFFPLLLHIFNIIMLKYRAFLVHRNAPPPVLSIEKNDSTILVY